LATAPKSRSSGSTYEQIPDLPADEPFTVMSDTHSGKV